MRRLFAGAFVLLLVGGCASVNTMMRSWEGHSEADLLSAWGPPQVIMQDGQGGQVFVYTQNRSYTAPGTVSSTATVIGSQIYTNTVYNPSTTYSWQVYRMFFIDSRGRIYRWAWRGL